MDAPLKKRSRSVNSIVIRSCFALTFSLFTFLSLSFAVAILSLILGTFSITSPISVPSQCKIISSSVDLRSSRICELGLLNYKAKRVFYPSERRKFRCRYDYYWASIFEVEYREHFSGQTLLGLAEAPKEALPSDCRPNFAAAWSTKHMLKVHKDDAVMVIRSAKSKVCGVGNGGWCCWWLLDSSDIYYLIYNMPSIAMLDSSSCCCHSRVTYSPDVPEPDLFSCGILLNCWLGSNPIWRKAWSFRAVHRILMSSGTYIFSPAAFPGELGPHLKRTPEHISTGIQGCLPQDTTRQF